ncbi:MAG: aminotransferase class IV [Bacteroidetes bacterium]|nr:aminotransferase class IV [Bacteroidota bacterium]MDA1120243.1 aminotransferase class IV [Bacteroidota bacterium]
MLQKFNSKNTNILVSIDNQLIPREQAKISVFDSAVQGGDAVWEGLRVYKEGIFSLDKHLERLENSAKALAFEGVPEREVMRQAIFSTLEANNMKKDAHIRLTLTRGEKVTSGMDPRLNQKGCCLIVLAEWKPPVYDNAKGIRVITSAIRRNNPQMLDSKIHHNNLLNNILAKIQANVAGADAAIMLDDNGFVSELNDTNIFMVNKGVLYTPSPDSCLPGITRSIVINEAKTSGIDIVERNISLTECYTADEVFATGTMGELTPIIEIDGRKIKNEGEILALLQEKFRKSISEGCEKLPF